VGPSGVLHFSGMPTVRAGSRDESLAGWLLLFCLYCSYTLLVCLSFLHSCSFFFIVHPFIGAYTHFFVFKFPFVTSIWKFVLLPVIFCHFPFHMAHTCSASQPCLSLFTFFFSDPLPLTCSHSSPLPLNASRPEGCSLPPTPFLSFLREGRLMKRVK